MRLWTGPLASAKASSTHAGKTRASRRGTSRKLNADLQCPYDHIQMFTAPLGMLTQKPVQTCPQCYGLFLSHGILDDIILGEAGNDRLLGGDGNDLIFGGDGKDRLYGQAGNDYLDGGSGKDSVSGGDDDDTAIDDPLDTITLVETLV